MLNLATMEKKNTNFKIAILVDGDNAQPKLLKSIVEEVSKYGKATIRRIYGDWTSPQMNSWKDKLNDMSFNPIQKFSYTTGKNSTDSLLIIDAMDILHNKNVDGFCIVSSDSDYTGLAKRIREEGVFVMGIGEKKTPNAFVQSCEIFTFSENILMEEKAETNEQQPVKKKTGPKRTPLNEKEKSVIDKAFEISIEEEEEITISKVGNNLRKINPSFDPRAFGYKNLTQLFQHLPKYEVIKNEVGGLNHPLVRKSNKLKGK